MQLVFFFGKGGREEGVNFDIMATKKKIPLCIANCTTGLLGKKHKVDTF